MELQEPEEELAVPLEEVDIPMTRKQAPLKEARVLVERMQIPSIIVQAPLEEANELAPQQPETTPTTWYTYLILLGKRVLKYHVQMSFSCLSAQLWIQNCCWKLWKATGATIQKFSLQKFIHLRLQRK